LDRDDLPAVDHGHGADLEHLHDMGRASRPRHAVELGQRLVIGALKFGIDLNLLLRSVKIVDNFVQCVKSRPAHGMPKSDDGFPGSGIILRTVFRFALAGGGEKNKAKQNQTSRKFSHPFHTSSPFFV